MTWRGWLAAACAVGALSVVWSSDPQGQFFYPRCWLHESTGLLCPGCGATRALHALLHGDLRTAWTLNPLVVALLPVGLAYGLRSAWALRTGRRWTPLSGARQLAVLTAVAFVFGIVRNLPCWP